MTTVRHVARALGSTGSAAPAYRVDLHVGPHQLVADEPRAAGGGDLGPSPFGLLLSVLAACTATTLRMYAARQGWDLTTIDVDLRYDIADDRRGASRDRPKAESRESGAAGGALPAALDGPEPGPHHEPTVDARHNAAPHPAAPRFTNWRRTASSARGGAAAWSSAAFVRGCTPRRRCRTARRRLRLPSYAGSSSISGFHMISHRCPSGSRK
jgi:hypothetical protein